MYVHIYVYINKSTYICMYIYIYICAFLRAGAFPDDSAGRLVLDEFVGAEPAGVAWYVCM